MISRFKKNVICSLVAFTLAACGSSSDDESETNGTQTESRFLTVSGKAIDGYIVGGTVFLDINGNGKAEPNEPQKLTEEGGDYSLEVPEADAECLAYSAIIVDVPVGAWDEGSEEEGIEAHEVTEPYQVTVQPTFEPITEQNFTDGLTRDISPLTTIIWESIERSFPLFAKNNGNDANDSEKNAKHCHYLKKHDEVVTELRTEIVETLNSLVAFYNLSADQMYADFIANNDSEAFHAAQDIMKGLKSAYKRRVELQEAYPDAEIRVYVYRSEMHDKSFDVEDGWYRDEVVFLGGEDFVENVKLKDTDSLDQIDFITSKFHELGQAWNDQDKKGWLSVRKDAYRNANGTYRCAKNERVSFEVSNIHYELGNGSNSDGEVSSFEACNFEDFTSPYERNYYVRYEQDGATYSAELYFREEQTRFAELSEWIAFEKESALDAQDMIDIIALTPYQWDAEVTIDTAYWRKRMVKDKVTIDVDNEGNWRKATLQEDGTQVHECSSDGEDWVEC